MRENSRTVQNFEVDWPIKSQKFLEKMKQLANRNPKKKTKNLFKVKERTTGEMINSP